MSEIITIIGTGNVAWQLAPALERAGHVINEVYGRSEEKALQVGALLDNPVISISLDFSRSSSTLFIIAVSDNAIESVVSRMVFPDQAVLVHTSGTAPLSILKGTDLEHVGVFYPLQSISRNRRLQFFELPLLIEASDASTQQQLEKIGGSLGAAVTLVNSEDRLGIHLAAVFANNFTNHMIEIASQVMDSNGMDFQLLKPLISETVEKAFDENPSAAQTGPAIRGDTGTMEKHLARLAFNPRYQALYKLISESISQGKL